MGSQRVRHDLATEYLCSYVIAAPVSMFLVYIFVLMLEMKLRPLNVQKSRTRLSNFTFTFHFHALEKEMATHSSVLAWRISGTGEPGGLPSMGSHRVEHD